MLPKKPGPSDNELFRMLLKNMIDPGHALLKLAKRIDWAPFDAEFGKFYTDKKGRPGPRTRLMVGLHFIKHMEGLFDEDVCALWMADPCWQWFCGKSVFQHRLVLERSSMTRWRWRIGPDNFELLLAETLRVAMDSRALDKQACKRVTVGTTVQTVAGHSG